MTENKPISELLDNYKDTAQDDISSVIDNTVVSSFCSANELSEEYIKQNYLIFSQFVSNRNLCDNCNGLPFCKQKREGERFELAYQKPVTTLELNYCDYKKLSVKKDGGDVDAITASTITSRAYTLAVVNALKVFDTISVIPGVTGNLSEMADQVGHDDNDEGGLK